MAPSAGPDAPAADSSANGPARLSMLLAADRQDGVEAGEITVALTTVAWGLKQLGRASGGMASISRARISSAYSTQGRHGELHTHQNAGRQIPLYNSTAESWLACRCWLTVHNDDDDSSEVSPSANHRFTTQLDCWTSSITILWWFKTIIVLSCCAFDQLVLYTKSDIQMKGWFIPFSFTTVH